MNGVSNCSRFGSILHFLCTMLSINACMPGLILVESGRFDIVQFIHHFQLSMPYSFLLFRPLCRPCSRCLVLFLVLLENKAQVLEVIRCHQVPVQRTNRSANIFQDGHGTSVISLPQESNMFSAHAKFSTYLSIRQAR